MVEHLTVNQVVPGSSPGRGAKQKSTMFFYIGNECKLLEQVDAGLFLDKGWTQVNSVWYKGYSTECNLSENIDNILNGYKPKGIWCMISSVDSTYKVYNPKLCNFPFNGFTNLYNNNVVHNYLAFNNSINSMDVVIDNVVSTLVDIIQGYAKYNSDILNIWCTGGLDSILLLAICEKVSIPYNLYVDHTHSRTHNVYETDLIKHVKNEFSNYSFMSMFSEKTILATGYSGDSFFCRHPEQINLLANVLNLTAHDVVNSNQYVYAYLKRPMFSNMNNIFGISEEEAKTRILHGIAEWFSVWHIDNTITFTPFHDEDLIRMVLTLPIHELIEASSDGTVQKKAIEKCNPDLLLLVDNQKNTVFSGLNLNNNINRVKLNCCKKIFNV